MAIMTGSTIQTNYYANGGDSPAWIGLSDGSWTRNIEGIDGSLGAIVSSTGSDELQLTNLHGDVVATAPNTSNADGTDAYFESTEFGIPRTSNPTAPRYAWLGGKRRDSGDARAGTVLMGERLYSPILGRFLQVDPVKGGSANSYDYAYQDPLNRLDPEGKWGLPMFRYRSTFHHVVGNPWFHRHNPYRSWGTTGWFFAGFGLSALAGGFVALGVAIHVMAAAGGPFGEGIAWSIHVPWIAAGLAATGAGYSFKRAFTDGLN